MRKIALALVLGSLVGLAPASVFAADDALWAVYAERGDLRAAFDAEGKPVGTAAGFLMNLEDWARQYGWSEYPELAAYAPLVGVPTQKTSIVAPLTSSPKYIVIDDASGAILVAKAADQQWPIASITKLMTGTVAIEQGIDLGGKGSIKAIDNVGGASLAVIDGASFTMRDIFAAMLVASANNAANAIARLTGLEKTDFVGEMNEYAASLGLSHTAFVDPTGIETGNVSTAREVAYFAGKAFAKENIRKFAGATRVHISALNTEYVRDLNNSNKMLYDPAYDDIYVTAGKTGYLDESGWNLVVQMHPMGEAATERSLTVVVFGAAGRWESFDDAATLGRWAWKNFRWE